MYPGSVIITGFHWRGGVAKLFTLSLPIPYHDNVYIYCPSLKLNPDACDCVGGLNLLLWGHDDRVDMLISLLKQLLLIIEVE